MSELLKFPPHVKGAGKCPECPVIPQAVPAFCYCITRRLHLVLILPSDGRWRLECEQCGQQCDIQPLE
jgi:hypothetical protein